LAFKLFIVSGLSELKEKQSSMIGGLYRLFTTPSFVPHIIEVALCGLTLLIYLWDFTRVSNIFM
jgi:hypothetical protein